MADYLNMEECGSDLAQLSVCGQCGSDLAELFVCCGGQCASDLAELPVCGHQKNATPGYDKVIQNVPSINHMRVSDGGACQ